MKVDKLISVLSANALALPNDQREVNGVYIGDLLSWVMGRATQDDAWITIMSNINIIAVASLVDTSLVILAEGVVPNQDIIDAAQSKGINLISTEMTAYQVATKLSELL